MERAVERDQLNVRKQQNMQLYIGCHLSVLLLSHSRVIEFSPALTNRPTSVMLDCC